MKKVKSEKFLHLNGIYQCLLMEYPDLGFLVRDYESFGKFTMHRLLLLHVWGMRWNSREPTDSNLHD